ncbi:MAG: Ig-like domain-containing protein [Cytophagales bacterium]|jgi:CDGSH-type Zn-finger protein|nr:Ig-like domain-containing protein [Cytophagales bacterium]
MLQKIFFCFFSSFFLIGCAKTTTLEGGPKDEIAPKLINQKPKNDLCGVSTKKKFSITLRFDKNIYLKNPEQIVITPKLKNEKDDQKNFDCFNDDDTVTLVIYRGLEKDTTYSINFNNTIVGVRTDKPLDSQIVTFSTGDSVDKNIFSGKVFNPMKLTPLNKGIVCLYDFESYDEIEIQGQKKKVHANIISSKQPDYFAKTDEKGNFKFTNPAPGKYLCCAGESKEGKPYCDPCDDCYGFKSVEVKKNSEVKEVINIFEADITDFKIISSQNKGRYFNVKFSKPIVDYAIKADIKSKFYQDLHIFSQLLEDARTVRIFNYGMRLIDGDSLRSKIVAHDKIGNKLEENIFINFSQGQRLPDDFQIFISNENLKRNLVDGIKLKIFTSLPLLNFNPEKIFLLINEKYPLELDKKDFHLGEHRNEIFINKKFNLQKFLEQNDPMHKLSKASKDDFQIDVFVKEDALESVLKSKNKEVKKKFVCSTKIGSIAGNALTKGNVTIQLLNEHLEVVDENKKSKFLFKNLAPGKYFLRALYHKDKKWDCGNIFELKQPEKVIFHNEIIEVLPNWKKENIFLTDISLF